MFLRGVLIILTVIACSFVCDQATEPTETTNEEVVFKSVLLDTPLGKIRGHVKDSHLNIAGGRGKKFSAFEGIPYAKPPVGNLRFKEPEPVEPWKELWEALAPSICIQTGLPNPNIIHGEEDCLHINVYVPREVPNPEEKLDVIVHIHGGAYMFGSGHSYANPQYFMDHDVIFVNFNYRLGILGFLNTEDDVVPGNNGMKDQVLALKWVQDNIASFGGNPDSVTLTGFSAGGSSVHLHYLSPLSKGLFHRGFSQSCVALNSFSLQKEPLEKAKILATAVGCPDTPTKVLVDCLRQRPANQLLEKIPLFYGYKFLPVAPFAPVIEKGGSNRFLDKNPYYLLAKGEVQDLPWIASNTADEGHFLGIFMKEELPLIDEKWTELAPFILDFNQTLARSLHKVVASDVKAFYVGEEGSFSDETYDNFVKMLSDRLYVTDAETAARTQAKVNKSPVYYYHFSYVGELGDNKTVTHGADGNYMFYRKFDRKVTSNELKMMNIMVEMVVSFAKTGKPEIAGVTWTPTQADKLTYLNISSFKPEEIKLQTVDELSPRKFWLEQNFLENQNLVMIKDEL